MTAGLDDVVRGIGRPPPSFMAWGARPFGNIGLRQRAWWLVLLVGVGLAVRSGTAAFAVWAPSDKGVDFAQEYVLAHAVLDGINGYLPMGVLANRYGVPPHPDMWAGEQNPSPHPPPVGLLFIPLAFLDYPTSAAVWLRLEVAFLGVTALLLLGAARCSVSVLRVLALAALLLGLAPVADDLMERNLMILLLVLLAAARSAVLSGRASLGGALVGVSLLVKPVAWPLLLLFAIRRDWRLLRASLIVLALGYVVTVPVFGFGRLFTYFIQVLPANNALFAHVDWNYSLWTIGWRFFEGSGGAAPLIRYQPAAAVASAALPTLALLIACVWARTQRDFDRGFSLFLCVSILVSPVAWGFYLVLTVIPAAHLLTSFAEGSLQRMRALLMVALIALVLLLVVPIGPWWKLAHLITGQSLTSYATTGPLPFLPSLLLLMPTVLLATLASTLASLRVRRRSETPLAVCA